MNRRKLLATSAATLGALLVGEKDSKADMVVERRRRKKIPNELELEEKIKTRLAIEAVQKYQQNLQKARNALEALAGYSQKEIDEIRKAVTKHLPKAKDYKQEFLTKTWCRSLSLEGLGTLRSTQLVELWCAIAVTFCSAGLVDGFTALEIEFLSRIRENLIA